VEAPLPDERFELLLSLEPPPELDVPADVPELPPEALPPLRSHALQASDKETAAIAAIAVVAFINASPRGL
jgi:hypothetical protein